MAALLRKSVKCSRIATSHAYRLMTFTIASLNCRDKTLPGTLASCWGKNFNSTSIFHLSFLALVCQKMKKKTTSKQGTWRLGSAAEKIRKRMRANITTSTVVRVSGTLRAIDQNRMPGKSSGHEIPLCANQLWSLESLQNAPALASKRAIHLCQDVHWKEASQLCCLWQESHDVDRKKMHCKKPRSWVTFRQMHWKRDDGDGCIPNLWNVPSKRCCSFASKSSSYLTHQTTDGWLLCPVPYGGLGPEFLFLALWEPLPMRITCWFFSASLHCSAKTGHFQ